MVYDLDENGEVEITLQAHTTEGVRMGITNTMVSDSFEEVEVGEGLIYERHLKYQL